MRAACYYFQRGMPGTRKNNGDGLGPSHRPGTRAKNLLAITTRAAAPKCVLHGVARARALDEMRETTAAEPSLRHGKTRREHTSGASL